MRKIAPEYENPIDNIMYDLAELCCPLFRATGHTPNLITTYSLMLRLLATYLLWHNHLGWFMVLFWVSYFLDNLDGHYARKYKITSRFGEMYDHGCDIGFHALVLFVIWRHHPQHLVPMLIITAVFGALMNLHLGCQQQVYQAPTEETLINLLQSICPDPKYMKVTRYFGPGTFELVFAVTTAALLYN